MKNIHKVVAAKIIILINFILKYCVNKNMKYQNYPSGVHLDACFSLKTTELQKDENDLHLDLEKLENSGGILVI